MLRINGEGLENATEDGIPLLPESNDFDKNTDSLEAIKDEKDSL